MNFQLRKQCEVRLKDFIRANIEPILVEWTAFAGTQAAAGGMTRTELRDHAGEILRHIARDLGTPQTDSEALDKSHGNADSGGAGGLAQDDGVETPAETHGADRAESGFSFAEMIAEFRALRASVLRLWITSRGTLSEADLQDLMRFNEAIDQAVAESVSRFSRDLEAAKDLFIAILSHDLRTPLQAVLFSTRLLLESDMQRADQTAALLSIERSSWRMSGMIADLLDFTNSRIGAGISISRIATDLGRVVRDAVDEARAAHPGCVFELRLAGDLACACDTARLRQVFANLLSNAADYSNVAAPVKVDVVGSPSAVVFTVVNRGELIPRDRMQVIFEPFKRLRQVTDESDDSRHLGLGLYIADQIVTAHGGRIGVTSTEAEGTCFNVSLPR